MAGTARDSGGPAMTGDVGGTSIDRFDLLLVFVASVLGIGGCWAALWLSWLVYRHTRRR